MSIFKIEIADDLACRASQIISAHLELALDQRDRAQISLSGGSTPEKTYELLSKEQLPWNRVEIFLGDERWVDPQDISSNAFMINRTLLKSGPGSKATFHSVPVIEMISPEASAKAYADILKKSCIGQPPIFDLMVLGLGEDGHTASLFPGTDAVHVQDRWVVVGAGKGLQRITLTAPVLSAARKVIFIVSGSSKQEALRRLIDPSESVQRTPARLVRPDSEILVLADEAAAAGIEG